MTIGEKIQSLRKSKGLSQEQLAEELGVSRQAVSKWEAEQSVPDIDKIIALSEFFGVATDYILRDVETAPRQEDRKPSTIPEPSEEETQQNEKNRKISTVLLAIAVILYIVCAAPLFIFQDSTGLVILLIIVAIATGLIIYRAIFNTKNTPPTKTTEENHPAPKLKAIKSTINTIIVVLYFIISFATGAWHLTWIIFLIGGAVKNIAVTLYREKEDKNK